MSPVTGVHHMGLTVRNLERSRRFYTDVVGFEEIFAWNPDAAYIGTLVGHQSVDLHASILRMPKTHVCLELLEYRSVQSSPVHPDNANPGTAHLAFYVDDLDEVFASWAARGVEFVSHPVEPTIGPNKGGKAVYMIDPDGIRVELIETKRSFQDFGTETR